MPFKLLTFFLATFYCLLFAQRGQAFASIDVCEMQVTENRDVCYINAILRYKPNYIVAALPGSRVCLL